MEPAFRSAAVLAASGRGCVEPIEHFIARMERFNPGPDAIAVFDFDRARGRETDAALARGKDSCDISPRSSDPGEGGYEEGCGGRGDQPGASCDGTASRW